MPGFVGDSVLACDLGGTSLRLALVGVDGGIVASATRLMPSAIGKAGWSEADPLRWWAAFSDAAESLAETAPHRFSRVVAIAICGMTRSQVLLDAQGTTLRPAILWADTRAGEELASLRARLPAGHPEAAQISPFHPLARLWWLARHEAAVSQALAQVVEPKDYLNFRLTGLVASDPVSMARLQAAASLLPACGFDPGIVPPLVEPTRAMGVVQTGLAGALSRLAGVPVLAMANDTWASVIGFGALRPGFAYNISGTSEVFGMVGDRIAAAEGLMTVDWGQGLTQLGGPSQAGGDTLVWLLSLLGRFHGNPKDMAAALDELAGGARAAAPLIFLPYLQGERTPYWDADLRGALVGLGRLHGATDLLHAVMEGVAFVNRIVLERIKDATGADIAELRYGGGGAASAAWCQIKADILGCDVVVPAGEEHGILGAAIVAWTGLGAYPDLAAAQATLVRPARRYVPDPARQAHYDRLFTLFRAAEAALRPISHSLACWQRAAA
jgi:xylulokinase